MSNRNSTSEKFRTDVISAAEELFEGDLDMAERWLSKPLPAIDNKIPFDFIDTPERAQQLLDIIGRLEHGVWT
jgi:putative toxin-antitoxin system antitoxin component (TIGR02293 family)